MTLDEELARHLDRVTPAAANRRRNIEIVRHYYGFGDVPRATLEATAARFELGSRERVRQIVEEFRGSVTAEDLPRLRAAASVLHERVFWVAEDFVRRVAGPTAPRQGPAVTGLMQLLHDLRLVSGYGAFDSQLRRITRGLTNGRTPVALARLADLPQLRAARQLVRRRCYRLGLATGQNVAALSNQEIAPAVLEDLLSIDPDCWSMLRGEERCYVLEGRENGLVALAAKVFAVAERVEVATLAESLANSLRGRGARRSVDAVTLEAWIRASRFFEVDGAIARFRSCPAALTALETVLVDFLAARPPCDYPALKRHLQACGVPASRIPKVATLSPLIQVDRSAGPRYFSYSLIGRG